MHEHVNTCTHACMRTQARTQTDTHTTITANNDTCNRATRNRSSSSCRIFSRSCFPLSNTAAFHSSPACTASSTCLPSSFSAAARAFSACHSREHDHDNPRVTHHGKSKEAQERRRRPVVEPQVGVQPPCAFDAPLSSRLQRLGLQTVAAKEPPFLSQLPQLHLYMYR